MAELNRVKLLVSAFLLLFLATSLILPWSAFYRAFFFVGVIPVLLWAMFRCGVLRVVADPIIIASLSLVIFLTANTFMLGMGELDDKLQILRWALSTCFFIIGAYWASQRWVEDPLVSARLIMGLTLLGVLYTLLRYWLSDQYPGRISGDGFLGHPILGAAAVIALWAAGLVLYRLVCRLGKKDYLLIAIASISVFVFVVLSQSRGPVLSLMIFVILVAVLLVFSYKSRIKSHLIWVMVILGSGLAFYFLFDELVVRMIARGTSYRLEIWSAIIENPPVSVLFGGGSALDFQSTSAGLAIFEQIGSPIEHPHNLLLSVYMNAGLVGVAAFIGLMAFLLIRLLRITGRIERRVLPFALGLYCLIPMLNMTDGHRVIAPPSADWLFFWFPVSFLAAVVAYINSQKTSSDEQTV